MILFPLIRQLEIRQLEAAGGGEDGRFPQCRIVFAKLGLAQVVGRTPWSAAGRPRPALALDESGAYHDRGAGQGAGCGRGRPPHH
jgi:hypothetical protein